MSIAMDNHNLFISGQCGTGKHVLLRNKPRENAYFTPIGQFVILSISATHEHLVFYPGLTIKTTDLTASNRSLEVRRSDLLGISEYVSPHKWNNGWIYEGLLQAPASLAEKDLVLFPS